MTASPTMPTATSTWRRRLLSSAPWLAALLTASMVLALTVVIVTVQSGAHRDEVAATIVREGSRMRADLERAVDLRIARTEGLVGFAVAEASQGEIEEDLFRRYTQNVMAETSVPLRSMQLAPAAVVTYVEPIEGNEAAIGHDLLADPGRRAAVLATVEARRTMVAGPFELLQGGVAIVARAPVFVPTDDGGEEWWGLATIVADAEPLFEEAQLDAYDDMEVALRGKDGLGADGEVFRGDPAIFEQDPELFEVTLPAGSWQLAVVPAGGWSAVVWPDRTSTIAGMVLLALVLAGLVWRVVAARARVQRLLDDRAELIATANVPIVQVRADRRIAVWNAEASTEAGIDDPTGRDVHDPILQENGLVRTVAELVEETFATGARVEGHVALVEQPDGSTTELLCNAGPIIDSAGTVTDVVVVAQDISARAEAERIRRDHEALAATAKLKDEFLATMSHELRTPLNGILGLTSLLRDETAGPLNDTQQTYVRHTHEAGAHLLQLINDVLDISRIEAAENDLELQPVEVADAVARAVEMVRSDAEDRGLDVTVDVEPGLAVVADDRRLVQVLLNLLGNAVKFTDEGGVTVTATPGDDTVAIDVVDTGIGISAEDLHRMFEPFVQLEASLDRRYEGSGLGLALSRRLVEALDGRLEVQSRVDEGSRFTIVLPRATAATAAAPMPETGAAAPAAVREVTVLVAEDNDVNRLIVREYLGVLGYEYVEATNGVEAVELARTAQPALVLMDIQMPTMDGLEATGILKGDAATADIPVIALTALAMDGDEERCLAAGCDGYLPKPIELPALAATLEEHLGAAVRS